jgi:hypothetical protein
MEAIMVEDVYLDLEPNVPYEVEKVFSNTHIVLTKCKRKYLSRHFVLLNDNKKVTHAEAYRIYKSGGRN